MRERGCAAAAAVRRTGRRRLAMRSERSEPSGRSERARGTSRAGRTRALPRLFPRLVALLALGAAGPLELAVPADGAEPAKPFIRGDVDASHSVNLTDAVKILRYLFTEDYMVGASYRFCRDTWDVDDSGSVSVTDAVFLLGYLFHAAPAPPPPFPFCGTDPTEDDLACDWFLPCAPADRKVELYGETFEIDVAIFVIQSAESAAPKVESIKTEVRRSVLSMSDGVRWSALVFDRGLRTFPPLTGGDRILLVSSSWTRHLALEFFASVKAADGTCIVQALMEAYEFATVAFGLRTAILVVGSGENYCQGSDSEAYGKMALRLARAWSFLKVPIHTFDVASPNERSAAFLRDIASETGGTYTWVEH